MALLNGQGYLVDAFGRKLYISCNRRDNVNLNWWEQSEKSKRSIISQVVQSYEATVMEQIFDVLQDIPDVLVVGWNFDGMYLEAVNHKKSMPHTIRRINNAFNQRCHGLGLNLTLIHEIVE